MEIVIKNINKQTHVYVMDTWNRPVFLKITNKNNLINIIRDVQANYDINQIKFIVKSLNLFEDSVDHI